MGVAAEVVQPMDGRAERFFGIDDPGFMPQRFEQELEGCGVSQKSGLTDKEELVLSESTFAASSSTCSKAFSLQTNSSL